MSLFASEKPIHDSTHDLNGEVYQMLSGTDFGKSLLMERSIVLSYKQFYGSLLKPSLIEPRNWKEKKSNLEYFENEKGDVLAAYDEKKNLFFVFSDTVEKSDKNKTIQQLEKIASSKKEKLEKILTIEKYALPENEKDQEIPQKALEYLQNNKEKLIQKLMQREEGRPLVLNSDQSAKLLKEEIRGALSSNDIGSARYLLLKAVWNKCLNSAYSEFLFVAGGPGSGKSTLQQKLIESNKKINFIVDSSFGKGVKNLLSVQQIVNQNKKVHLIFKHTPFSLSFTRSIERYIKGKKAEKGGEKRIVTLDVSINLYIHSIQTFHTIWALHHENKNISFRVCQEKFVAGSKEKTETLFPEKWHPLEQALEGGIFLPPSANYFLNLNEKDPLKIKHRYSYDKALHELVEGYKKEAVDILKKYLDDTQYPEINESIVKKIYPDFDKHPSPKQCNKI